MDIFWGGCGGFGGFVGGEIGFDFMGDDCFYEE